MRVLDLPITPIHEVTFWNAGRHSMGPCLAQLPILHGRVDLLPEGYDALVVTSDLQGREDHEGAPRRLLGEILPAILRGVVLPQLGLSFDAKVAALLAGDFYTLPLVDKRGGTGDVQMVWAAFAESFDRVLGVPGNHDLFHSVHHPRDLPANACYLDDATSELGQLKIAGLGGIIGNPTKPHRRKLEDFLHTADRLLGENPDVFLMHEGPEGEDATQPGLPGLRVLAACRSAFVIRGHKHWVRPLAEIQGGMQVLNVEGRAVVLTR